MKDISQLEGKHIAIVALGKSWHDYNLAKSHGAQFDEVWAINAVSSVIFHDRVFMLDPASRFLDSDAAGSQTPAMREVLKTHMGPIYTCELDKRCPGLVEYPINDVMQAGKSCYLNNTVAYAVAFAYMCKVGRLSLYGVDYSYKGNLHFAEQGRGCVEYWLGKLISKGCNVGVGHSSSLLDSNESAEDKLYGYHRLDDPMVILQNSSGDYIAMKKSEYQQRVIPEPEPPKIVAGREDPPEPKKW
tara:strand:- start:1327 stop:2058 length:732 start_codon:yes stop_codon:yes gene_type:complete